MHHSDKQGLASLLGIQSRGQRSWIWRRGRSVHRSCCRHPCLVWSSSHHCQNLAEKRISAIHCRFLQEKKKKKKTTSVQEVFTERSTGLSSFTNGRCMNVLGLAQQGTEHFSPPIRTEISPCMYKHVGFL